jgi:hypothetical protein
VGCLGKAGPASTCTKWAGSDLQERNILLLSSCEASFDVALHQKAGINHLICKHKCKMLFCCDDTPGIVSYAGDMSTPAFLAYDDLTQLQSLFFCFVVSFPQ